MKRYCLELRTKIMRASNCLNKNKEVLNDACGKQQTATMKLLFSCFQLLMHKKGTVCISRK